MWPFALLGLEYVRMKGHLLTPSLLLERFKAVTLTPSLAAACSRGKWKLWVSMSKSSRKGRCPR
eukprot:CAMPEP_0184321530 /NCGR_PEP_ID=MMETSP1049-20130417/119601_1 /TAXON_ID=77928 /ORGANISM="Proteomonas sulcata, Strain CCMP704" /LENGTH=63 /DNA_ID=CAMNT_0026642371 /DNA_START=64 /DNA_END=255 /DNA_ORIENTATION=+